MMSAMSTTASTTPASASIETNLAYVFLTPDRAIKVLKPAELPFLDLRRPEDRAAAVRREFALNREFSPDVYLGIAELCDGSDQPELAIVMRRLDSSLTVDQVLERNPDCLRGVARHIASVHMHTPSLHGDDAQPATPDAIRQNWDENLTVLRRQGGTQLTEEAIEAVAAGAHAYVDGRTALFAEREAAGWIRAGHGDLRCEHVFVEGDRVALLDCLAFSERYRVADVLNDVSFLAMDLHRLRGATAAATLMRYWREFTNERHPSSLAHFYAGYRAHVRAKVEALRFESGKDDAAEAMRRYHDLAQHHVALAQPRLVLVGGGAGSGKSTLSQGLAGRLGAVWLRSDEIRKDLAGLGHDDHCFSEPGAGIYSAEMNARVYDELRRQTELLLSHGESVIVDATWSKATERMALRRVAETSAAEVHEVHCVLPRAIARERVVRRSASVHNPSDATAEIVDFILDHFEPWPRAHEIRTDRSINDSLETALAAITDRGQPAENRVEPRNRFFADVPITLSANELTLLRSAAVIAAVGTLGPTPVSSDGRR